MMSFSEELRKRIDKPYDETKKISNQFIELKK